MRVRKAGVVGLCVGLAMVLGGGWAPAVHAKAIIVHPSGMVALGVNDTGELNVLHSEVVPSFPSTGGAFSSVNATGVRFFGFNSPEGVESTAPGCLCEGWGAAVASTGVTGYRNRSAGDFGVTLVSFLSDASTATSVVTIGGVMQVTHNYHPSASPYLYQADVTIKNISGAALGSGSTDIRYRRVMDWDTEPTPFSEKVTLQGWPATALFRTSNDGFETANPLGSFGGFGSCPENANFTDCGFDDHGAMFDFAFPELAADGEQKFKIFYGGAPSEAAADFARALVGIEVYSYGQCDPSIGPWGCNTDTGTPVTYIFGFSGVGGTPPPPPGVPSPATLILLGAGLAGLGAIRIRRGK